MPSLRLLIRNQTFWAMPLRKPRTPPSPIPARPAPNAASEPSPGGSRHSSNPWRCRTVNAPGQIVRAAAGVVGAERTPTPWLAVVLPSRRPTCRASPAVGPTRMWLIMMVVEVLSAPVTGSCWGPS
jgi:hypothetical protein